MFEMKADLEVGQGRAGANIRNFMSSVRGHHVQLDPSVMVRMGTARAPSVTCTCTCHMHMHMHMHTHVHMHHAPCDMQHAHALHMHMCMCMCMRLCR